jgi:zinc protease
VTLEQANAAIRTRLSADDLVVSVVGTHEVLGDAITKAIPRLAEAQVVPFDTE